MASVTSDPAVQPTGPSDDQQSYSFSTEQVVLDVGGRKFTTTVGTLVDRSDFFAAMFSGRWTVHKQADGSVFVDADPAIFAPLLGYLRRGVFPLTFDKKTGEHDISLYVNLLAEARYFQVRMLEAWLEDELYLKCVDHESYWRRIQGDKSLKERSWSSGPGAELVKEETTLTHGWVCPETLRRVAHENEHHGYCSLTPGQGALNRRERTQWVEYEKKISFTKGWCTDDGWVFNHALNCVGWC